MLTKLFTPPQPVTEDDLSILPIGILQEYGTIIPLGYQLANIHEFLEAFCQPNTDETPNSSRI